jgi:hypothetical protein
MFLIYIYDFQLNIQSLTDNRKFKIPRIFSSPAHRQSGILARKTFLINSCKGDAGREKNVKQCSEGKFTFFNALQGSEWRKWGQIFILTNMSKN